MKGLYLESSAVLAWLLGEPEAEHVIQAVDQADAVITATLTLVESERTLIRAEQQELITAAGRRRLRALLRTECRRWDLLAFTASIQARASEPFPVEPVRSLDAIHLASALEACELFPELYVLSFDKRIQSNLAPLGLAG